MLNKLLTYALLLSIIVTICVAFSLTAVSGSITVSFGNAPYAMFAEALR